MMKVVAGVSIRDLMALRPSALKLNSMAPPLSQSLRRSSPPASAQWVDWEGAGCGRVTAETRRMRPSSGRILRPPGSPPRRTTVQFPAPATTCVHGSRLLGPYRNSPDRTAAVPFYVKVISLISSADGRAPSGSSSKRVNGFGYLTRFRSFPLGLPRSHPL